MATPGFRDILLQMLEEKAPQPEQTPSQNPSATPFTSTYKEDILVNWRPEAMPKAPPRTSYPQGLKATFTEKVAEPTETPPPPPKPKPEEPTFKVIELSAMEKVALGTFTALGANELAEKISVSSLKAAHRRLVKSLHPDALGGFSAKEIESRLEKFLRLQKSYELLHESLKKKAAPHAKAA